MKVTMPKKMCIRCGTTFHDLQDLHQLEVGEDPSGWIKVDLSQVAADTTNQFFEDVVFEQQKIRSEHIFFKS